MTKKKEETVQAAQETLQSSAPVFSIEKLRNNCMKLFGISVSTFDGVSHGLNGEYTIAEMKKIIAAWQNKEAK